MADEKKGTGVGSIFLDLIVRNTVGKQVREIASEAQNTAKSAFSGMEKAAESAANRAAASATKVTEKVASGAEKCAKSIETSIGKSTDKAVAMAQLKLKQLEERLAHVTASRKAASASGDDKATERLLAQQTRLYDQVAAARERLAVTIQFAEAKQAAAAKAAAQKAVVAEEKAASRRKSIHASMWKNMLASAGSSTKAISAKIGGIIQKFTTASRAARRFGSRLREIATGALFFNGISAALRSMVSYMGEAVSSSDEMKRALSNLKGAAANAASPIIQVLTPALTQLTNAAATALSYLARLATMITGKVSTAAATAAKSAKKTAGAAKEAARSLAGFDTIERLGGDSKDSDSDNDSIAPNYNFQGKSPFLDSLMAALEAGQWGQIGDLIAQKLNNSLAAVPWENIQNRVKGWTQNLTDALNGLARNVDWGLVGRSIGNGVNTLLEPFHEFVNKFDFREFGAGIARMVDAALDSINWKQLIADVGKLLAGLFEGAVAFVREADADTLGVLFGGLFINVAKTAFGVLGPEITKGLRNLLKPGAMDGLKAAFGSMGSWITGTLVPAISAGLSSIAGALGISVGWVVAIGAAIAVVVVAIAKHWDDIVAWTKKAWEKVKKAWENAPEWFSRSVAEPVAKFFSDLWERASELSRKAREQIDQIWENASDWFAVNITEPIKSSFADLWTRTSELGEQAWSGMQNTWRSVSEWFQNHVVSPIRDAFSSVYNSVSDTWRSLVGFIKNSVNSIIGSINGMISGVTNGINAAIRALNRLSFTVPEWLQHVPGATNIAGKKFGFNLQTITAPQIPYLANGGVIQQPTLAMMGEYAGARNNPEIATPQSLMEETVASVMEDVMSRNAMAFEEMISLLRDILQAVLGIEIGDEVIGKAAARYNRRMSRAGGY